MKISPKLKWLTPYLHLALPMLPEGKKIVRLGAWSITNKRNGKDRHASIHTDDWLSYRIWMNTHYNPSRAQYSPFSKIDMLSNLAHELAHTLDMDHTPEHKTLELNILNMFMVQLKSEGYESEEIELSDT